MTTIPPPYITGTLSIAAGGTVATGVGASWSSVNARWGDVLQVGNFQSLILDATDVTHLSIPPWGGGAVSGAAYAIYRSSPARYAGADAMADVQTFIQAFNTAGFIFFVAPGATAPDPSYGNDGQFAYQPSTGEWWEKLSGVWTPSSAPVAGYGGTSATSLVIANSVSRVFTTQAALAYNGARVRAASAANPANYMEGVCLYSGTTLTMTVDAIGGSGTKSDWLFSIAGQPGSSTGNMLSTNNLSDVSNPATARSNISAVLRGQLWGLTLSTVGASATFNVNAGEAADSTAVNLMAFPQVYSKTTAAWAVGNGFGSLDFFSIAASTWYYPYLIKRPDTGVTDILASLAPGTSSPFTITLASPGVVTQTAHGLQTNAPWNPTTTGALPTGLASGTTYFVKTVTGPNTFTVSATGGGTAINTSGSQSGTHTATSNPTLPTNYTLFRRIGALKTDGSSNWTKFVQIGDEFMWDIPTQDVSAANPGTAAQTVTLNVPPGIKVGARVAAGAFGDSAQVNSETWYLSSLDVSDQTASPSGAFTGFAFALNNTTAGLFSAGGPAFVYTSTAGQIRYRLSTSASNTSMRITTVSWVDHLGRNG